MPRFVVLWHETPAGYPRGSHFDLMLEQGEALRTWALENFPAPGESVIAERLPDHRLAYLQYEGEVQGERGTVRRVDAGEYEYLQESTTLLVARIHGNKMQGTLTLNAEDESTHRWRVSFSKG